MLLAIIVDLISTYSAKWAMLGYRPNCFVLVKPAFVIIRIAIIGFRLLFIANIAIKTTSGSKK